ncbi:hypothetical protein BSL78_18660 [Apostichopus japonicus]|uniref:Uncharacterized protein n=1 Tax=Stichopus japonicus TaxID=307972 RepID=A0A2G8K8Z8_STIJA|nr:hypothetical protein BSL78_18660 [Apostichopus japonicus]
MESKKTLACPVEEDSKTSKEESTKPEENQSELVVEGGETLPPFEPSVTKGSTDDTKLSKETNSDNQGNAGFFPAWLVAIYFLSTHYVKAIWCYLMSGFLNAPHGPATRFLNRVHWKILGSKSCLCSVAIVLGALIMMSMIPGASASASVKCVGNSYYCLSLAQNGTEGFDDDCVNVRCLHLSKGQIHLLRYFTKVEELFMDDMGNITIPCDVLKNLSNLHKIDLHVKNIFPTVACNTSCVLSEVTVAVLHNTTAIPCKVTEWMPNLKSFSFVKAQAPTSVPPGIISEGFFTTAANMVNQGKDAGFSVGVIIGVAAVVVLFIGVAFGVGILLHRNKMIKSNRVQVVLHLCKMV